MTSILAITGHFGVYLQCHCCIWGCPSFIVHDILGFYLLVYNPFQFICKRSEACGRLHLLGCATLLIFQLDLLKALSLLCFVILASLARITCNSAVHSFSFIFCLPSLSLCCLDFCEVCSKSDTTYTFILILYCLSHGPFTFPYKLRWVCCDLKKLLFRIFDWGYITHMSTWLDLKL